MRRRWLLIFVLCRGLSANPLDCLAQFAAVSENDPDGLTRTAATYDLLLDTLGGKVTPATLQKMLDGKNPFAVPEQPGTELFALQSKLQVFEAMLTQRKWHTAETTDRLLAHLSTRMKRLTAQAEKLASITAGPKDRVFEGTVNVPATAISPDGRWLVMLPHVGEDSVSTILSTDGVVRITDLVTGATREVMAPTGHVYTGRLAFGPDGKSLLFVTRFWNILSVPFEDGVPKWEARVESPLPFARDGITPARPGENSHYAFADRRDLTVRMNVLTKREDRISYSADVTKDRFYFIGHSTGSVGQSDNVYAVLESQAGDGRIVVFDMAPDGTAKGHRVVAEWNQGERFGGLTWTNEGKPITLNGNKFYEWPTSTEPKPIMETTGIPPWNTALRKPVRSNVQTHPTVAVVLYFHGGGTKYAEVFDFQEKRQTGTIPLPKNTESISLSPDGQRLIVKAGERVHVMNYKMRME